MPKSRAHSKKKISSPEAFSILKNWHTHKTVLWFVSFRFADVAGGPDVRVESISPARFVLRRSNETDPKQDFSFAFADVEFWRLSEGDIPINLSGYVSFLGFKVKGNDVPFLLAEEPVRQ
jgi:hypothetical protein